MHGGTDHAVSTEDIGTTAGQDRSLCGGIPGYLRVQQAREIQKERFMEENIRCNGEMAGRHIRKYCVLGNEEETFMEEIFEKLALSARMHDRILKVARTTADLAGASEFRLSDLCEAVSYV